MDTSQLILKITYYLIFILSGTCHEFAHAFAAHRLGDDTARLNGRMSLNPLVHIDPIGTIIMPLLIITTGLPAFGWMRPVPIYPFNFKQPKKGYAISSFAGPFVNLLIALAAASFYILLFYLMQWLVPAYFWNQHPQAALFYNSLQIFIYSITLINLLLAFFNLLPIPPLDGGGILMYFVPAKYESWFSAIQQYGFLVVLLLMVTGLLDKYFRMVFLITNKVFFLYPLVPVLILGLFLAILSAFLWRTRQTRAHPLPSCTPPKRTYVQDFEKACQIVQALQAGQQLTEPQLRWLQQLQQEPGDGQPLCSPYSFYPKANSICTNCPNIPRCLLRYVEMEGQFQLPDS